MNDIHIPRPPTGNPPAPDPNLETMRVLWREAHGDDIVTINRVAFDPRIHERVTDQEN